MDIFFQDPTVIPLPPNEVRIKELRADLWPDNRRIHIYLELTPFQKRPNGEVTLLDPSGKEAASASIIETMVARMELTLHLRGEVSTGQYSVIASIYYEEPAEVEGIEDPTQPPKHIVVDTAKSTFDID